MAVCWSATASPFPKRKLCKSPSGRNATYANEMRPLLLLLASDSFDGIETRKKRRFFFQFFSPKGWDRERERERERAVDSVLVCWLVVWSARAWLRVALDETRLGPSRRSLRSFCCSFARSIHSKEEPRWRRRGRRRRTNCQAINYMQISSAAWGCQCLVMAAGRHGNRRGDPRERDPDTPVKPRGETGQRINKIQMKREKRKKERKKGTMMNALTPRHMTISRASNYLQPLSLLFFWTTLWFRCSLSLSLSFWFEHFKLGGLTVSYEMRPDRSDYRK